MSQWNSILSEQARVLGQEEVARRLGISKTVVSQLVNGKYPGDMARMQKLVEGAFMDRLVQCPILGAIALHQCDRHQGNKSTSNPIRLRLYRACRSGCPHSSLAAKPQFVAIAVTQIELEDKPKPYQADATYQRLERQSISDNGGYPQLCELLKQELIALGQRYNRLLNSVHNPQRRA